MGILDRIGRIVRAEVTAARLRAGETLRGAASPSSPSANRPATPPPPPADPLARHYARLEVAPGSDLPTLKAAYRRLMKRYHPDRHSTDEARRRVATEVAAALTESYDALVAHIEGPGGGTRGTHA